MTTRTGPSLEQEFVLMVKANGLNVFQKLANAKSLNHYYLFGNTKTTITDTYFDTEDRSLLKKKSNLRLRYLNGEYRLSAKSSSRVNLHGIFARKEIEIPWSGKAFTEVNQEMHLRLRTENHAERIENNEPEAFLVSKGLIQVQKRETIRETRRITPEDSKVPLAEMALDNVSYHVNGSRISLYEIEIESKSPSALSILRDIQQSLLLLFPNELIPWRYGKFLTGSAITNLIKSGDINKFVRAGTLTSNGLVKVEQNLKTRGFQLGSLKH